MSDTILLDKNLHYPVLIDEVLSIISPNNGGTFVDCTFGQGGYTKKILEFSRKHSNNLTIRENYKSWLYEKRYFYQNVFKHASILNYMKRYSGKKITLF